LSFHIAVTVVGTDGRTSIALTILGHRPVAPTRIGTSYSVVVTYGDPAVISVNVIPSVTVIVPIYLSDRSISSTDIVSVRGIIGISNGGVISPIRSGVHITESNGRSYKVPVVRHVHVMSIIDVDVSCIVTEDTSIVVNVQSTNSSDPTVVVPNVHISNLGNTPVIIIEYGNVLYLDHCPIIIILYKRVVVITRVEGDAHITNLGSNAHIHPVVHVEVELTIGIN
jgi:hypothetical protein